jgi:elongation factor 1-gamma
MSYVIYSYPNNPRVFKAQIAGKYSGIEIAVKEVELGKDNKSKDFLAKNPLGKVPTLDTPDGPIWESNAIARYVARQNGDPAKLYGNSVYESGLIDQWIDFSVNEVDLPASAWLYPIFGLIPENQAATKSAKGDIRKALAVLNTHLTDHQFLVGELFSLADIVVAMSLAPLYKLVLDPGFRKAFSAANRWFDLVVNQPKVKEVIGDFPYCTKMATAPKVVAVCFLFFFFLFFFSFFLRDVETFYPCLNVFIPCG